MKFVLMLVAILVMATNTACGSSPASPSATASPTPTPIPTFAVNVIVATQSLVQYTCKGTGGVTWRFELFWVGISGEKYLGASQSAVVADCGTASTRPPTWLPEPANRVAFKATTPTVEPVEVYVDLK